MIILYYICSLYIISLKFSYPWHETIAKLLIYNPSEVGWGNIQANHEEGI